MSIRVTLRERPYAGVGLASISVIFAMWFAWQALRTPSLASKMPSHLYFSDDNGATFFADDSARIPPFDHEGKTAYQAAVFRCAAGSPFVGYLLSFSPSGKAQLNALSESERSSLSPTVSELRASTVMAKRPGDAHWVSLAGDAPVAQILNPPCPNGSNDRPEQILP